MYARIERQGTHERGLDTVEIIGFRMRLTDHGVNSVRRHLLDICRWSVALSVHCMLREYCHLAATMQPRVITVRTRSRLPFSMYGHNASLAHDSGSNATLT